MSKKRTHAGRRASFRSHIAPYDRATSEAVKAQPSDAQGLKAAFTQMADAFRFMRESVARFASEMRGHIDELVRTRVDARMRVLRTQGAVLCLPDDAVVECLPLAPTDGAS